MQTMNRVLKWFAIAGGMSALALLAGVFTTWLMIETLVVLIDITA